VQGWPGTLDAHYQMFLFPADGVAG